MPKDLCILSNCFTPRRGKWRKWIIFIWHSMTWISCVSKITTLKPYHGNIF